MPRIIFSVFALLNLCLHRRVELLVLVSRPLEFRVLIIVVTATLADHRHHIPPPYSTTIFRHHKPSAIAFLPRHRSDQFPAVVRVRVELLSPSYFFLLSFFVISVFS